MDNGYRAKVWDAVSGREVFTYSSPTNTNPQGAGGAFSPDGNFLALTGFNSQANRGEVKVLDATTGQEVVTYTGHERGVNALASAPMAGASPRRARMRRSESGTLLRVRRSLP